MFPFPSAEKREQRAALESEQRQMDFSREQQAVGTALSDDQVYLHHQEKTEDLMRWQQDLGDELDLLVHKLRNEIYVEGRWVRRKDRHGKELPPMMNEEGIEAVEAEISPFLSRNLINTNYSDEIIRHNLKDTANTIVNLFAVNYDRYEIRMDPTHMTHILRMIKNVMKPAPYRALNDGERRHQRTINKRIEAYNETARPEGNKSFLQKLGVN